jgi:hypothetical protein
MPAFLLPLLLNLAPTVAGWVLGDKTSKAVDTVAEIIKKTTGVDGDPSDMLSADPALALQLKEALIRAESEERERQHQEVLARIADVASARQHTVELAKAGSPIAWGAPVVSVLAVAVFAGFVFLLFAQEVPQSMKDALMLMAGSAASGFGMVLSYWLGSSAGSAAKDATLGKLLR